MNKNNLNIRLENETEYREVENLVRESFWNVYRPGCLEHFVLHELRKDPDFVPELDFVLERWKNHWPEYVYAGGDPIRRWQRNSYYDDGTDRYPP